MPTTAAVATTRSPSEAAVLLVRLALAADPELRPTLLVHPRRLAQAVDLLALMEGGERARVVPADPAAIDFGLGRGEYQALSDEVRVVHHAYQVIDLAAPGELAERVNVGGAREIIELSRAARKLERVVHHSSVFVSGDRTGIVLERDLHAHQSFRSPVAASLALSEAMLRRHREVPLTVVRAAQVVGDTQSGLVERLDGLYPLLVFLANAPSDVPLPLPPRVDTPVHLVPVDYVAKAALAIAEQPDSLGETFHLVDPRPLTTRRLLELAALRFGKQLSMGWNPGMLGSLINNPGMGLLAQQLRTVSDLITRDVTYDDATATARLAPSGITCPPLESYLDVLLSHVEARASEKGSMRLREPADAVG
jgi:nucleoside-diphosphate-sugar epimerase